MKKSTLSFLCLAALTPVFVAFPADQAPPAAASAPLPEIPKAEKAIAVDGKLDEADWARALVVPVNLIWGMGSERTTAPRMTARFLWDNSYLYIGYEVWDTNLTARTEGSPQGPKNNSRSGCDILPDIDVVEFFLVFDDPNFFWEIHHNALNNFGDLLCLVSLPAWQKSRPALAGAGIYWGRQEYIQDQGALTLSRAVALKPRKKGGASTVNDASDTDTGYIGEIRLPWFGIGAPAQAQATIEVEPAKDGKPAVTIPSWTMKGREISILAISQNGDSPERYCTSAAGLQPGAFFHAQTAKYPRYRLTDKPATKGADRN